MANKIIIKNGPGIPPKGALDKAELGYDFDNKMVYIGTGENGDITTVTGAIVDLSDAIEGPGVLPSETYATKNFVISKIAEAQLGGAEGNVDLSAFLTKDDIVNFQTAEQVQLLIDEALRRIGYGT